MKRILLIFITSYMGSLIFGSEEEVRFNHKSTVLCASTRTLGAIKRSEEEMKKIQELFCNTEITDELAEKLKTITIENYQLNLREIWYKMWLQIDESLPTEEISHTITNDIVNLSEIQNQNTESAKKRWELKTII